MVKTRAAIWLRVSTGEQHAENQLPDLQAWAERRGWEVVKVYEVEQSAWVGEGPKLLSEVYNDARMGYFNILLVWALDRLSRRGPQAIMEIITRLEHFGCQIYSLQEPWMETVGATNRELLLAFSGWAARDESNKRSERTKAGMERARAEGKQIGRPVGSKDRYRRKRAGYFARYDRAEK